MAKSKDAGEAARWGVFLFVIVPLFPLGIVAFILGMAWAISKECFNTGANVLGVWDGYEPEGNE